MPEEWKDCVGFEGLYQVSSIGRIKRTGGRGKGVVVGKVLKTHDDGHGYQQLVLRKDKRSFHQKVHRLVAMAFIGNMEGSGMDVCHNDGDRSNNCVYNLRWDTRKGNMSDTVEHGTKQYGEIHKSANLTEDQVIAIIEDKRKQQDIADDYGISRTTVSAIKCGRNWKHLGKTDVRPSAIINEDDVRKIRKDFRPRKEIAAEYGITARTVSAIRNRENWKHVED